MLSLLVTLLIYLVVAGLIYYLAKIVLDLLPIDARFKNIIMIVLLVIFIIAIISLLLDVVPAGRSLRWG